MTDLIGRLRHHSVNAHQVKEIDVVYLHELFGRSANELEAKDKRIAELEGALRWEAGEVCENPEGECVVDYPDGPDLWCRYCRIMSVLAGGRDANL